MVENTCLKNGKKNFAKGQYSLALENFCDALNIEPQSLKVLICISSAYYRLREHDKSLGYLNRALEIQHDYIPAFWQRFLVYKEINQDDLAKLNLDRVISSSASTCEDWIAKGSMFSALGQFEDALKNHDRAIKIEPKSYEAWMYRGITLGNLERFEDALKSHDQAIKIEPELYEAWMHHGITLSRDENPNKDLKKALKSHTRAIAINPESHEVLMYCAITLSNMGDNHKKEAIDKFKKAIKIYDKSYELWRHYATTLATIGNEYKEEALESFNHAIEIKSDDYKSWFYKGNTFRTLKRFDCALECYYQAIKISPDSEKAWENHDNCIKELINQKRIKKVCEIQQKVLHFMSDNPDFLYTYASTLRTLGNQEQAIENYEKVIKIDPEHTDAMYYKGLTLQKMRKHQDAIFIFKKAINIDSRNPNIHYKIGISYRAIEDLDNALKSFKEATHLDPNHETFWSLQGDIQTKLKHLPEALESYKRALSINNSSYFAWTGKGIVSYNLNQYQEARMSYENALKYSENQSWLAWKQLGLIDRSLGKYENALKTWKRGLEKLYSTDPNYRRGCGELHYVIGQTQYKQGLQQGNIALWKQAQTSYEKSVDFLEENTVRYLEALQELSTTHLGLGEKDKAEELLRRGTEILDKLLAERQHPAQKKNLSLQFASLKQLTVTSYIRSGRHIEALETAEDGKNSCLTWLLSGWKEEIEKCEWEHMLKIVGDREAIIYWHLSPNSINTFVVKNSCSQPIVISSTASSSPDEIPYYSQQLKKLEKWIEEWDNLYDRHRNPQDKDRQAASSDWSQKLQENIDQLGRILDLSAILPHLEDIDRLILVPHRELHRFPLHALFPSNLTIAYLPSLQTGIYLGNRNISINNSKLLSIEHPSSGIASALPFAEIESYTITQILDNLHPRKIADKLATKETVISELKDEYNLFHFTGHATYNFEDPMKSALLLNGKDSLTIKDILEIQNIGRYDLITLSACETAITRKTTITQEYVGLVSAFIYLGAANVLSTLWTVEDRASYLFNMHFYGQLKKGNVPAVALAQSIKWLREVTNSELQILYASTIKQLSNDTFSLIFYLERKLAELNNLTQEEKILKPFDHPSYWCAFTITGKMGLKS